MRRGSPLAEVHQRIDFPQPGGSRPTHPAAAGPAAGGSGAGPSSPSPAEIAQAAAGSGDGALRTEFPFVLPRGFVDPRTGDVHRDGVMRLATARDELVPLVDDRVRENPNYLTVVLLARVITRLGGLTDLHETQVEQFFASDLAFLQDLYRRVNAEGHAHASVTCPSCRHEFAVDVSGRGTAAGPGDRLGGS